MQYNYHQLENGIRLIHRRKTGKIAHCGLMINAGTRDEISGKNGIAHFTEHLLFKGTKKRNAWQVVSRIENNGGEMNAYTTKEETCLHASFLVPNYELCLELFADILFNSVFPDHEIEKERDVVCDEINSYNDNPAELIFDDFESLIFAGHPIGGNILGDIEAVKSFHRSDITEFIHSNYIPSEMVISSVGDIDFKWLVKKVEKHFGLTDKREKKPDRPVVPAYQPKIFSVEKDSFLTHLIIGKAAYPRNHHKKLALILLNNLLGGPGMNSRLNQAIREKHGIAYAIESVYQPYSDTGVFAIYLGVDKRQLDKTFTLVYSELKKLRQNKLGEVQLSRAKKQVIGQLAISYESGMNEMLAIAKSHLYKPMVRTADELLKGIEAVSSDDLLGIANDLFDENKLSTLIFNSK